MKKLSIAVNMALIAAAFVFPEMTQAAGEGGGGGGSSSGGPTTEARCHSGYIQTRTISSSSSGGTTTITVSAWSNDSSSATCGDEKVVSQRSQLTKTTDIIGARAKNALKGGNKGSQKTASLDRVGTGLSAGDSVSGIGLWANYDFTKSDDNQSSGKADLHTVAFGGDHIISDGIAVGLALTGQWQDERFTASTQKTDIFTIAPYAALTLNEYLIADMTLGYSWLTDKSSTANANFDTGRWFGAANLTASPNDNLWDLSFNLGYRFAKDKVDSFGTTPSNDISFAQVHAGAELGYRFDGIEPYVNASYQTDLIYEASDTTYDPNGTQLGTGLRFSIIDLLEGDIHASTIVGRKDFSQNSIMANIKYAF
ncbi:MAG: autotransporter outer membrane beta-barrel domain-containing protein [Magnetococcales bacterium]|nr:autotransporter outer membrane beta-barrel domain-containing protein [Magnetococcales bacterium]